MSLVRRFEWVGQRVRRAGLNDGRRRGPNTRGRNDWPLPLVSRLSITMLVLLSMTPVDDAVAFDLGALFRTPAQQAAARLEAGEHEELIESAPDARWEGFARYRGGDAEGAAGAFARALEAHDQAAQGQGARDRHAAVRNDLLFEQATAETRAGRAAQALPLYDEILEADPAHADALHNRKIAEALLAMDQQASEGQSGGDAADESGDGEDAGQGEENADDASGGESADDADDGAEASAGSSASDEDSAEDSAESGDAEGDEGREGEAAGTSDRSSDDNGAAEDSEGTEGDGEAGQDAEPELPDASEQEAAREALAAEAEARSAEQGDDDPDGDDASAMVPDGADAAPRTPSEREQATEQWLRQIADDPAGLLRRRLEQSHRIDYPEVRESDEPW